MDNDDIVIESEDETLEGEGSSVSILNEKLKKIKLELATVKAERQEYLDGWQRAKADYVNIKKRSEEERSVFIRDAASGLLKAMLPALDSFEHAVASPHAQDPAWLLGIQNTYTQLIKALEAEGIVSFDPLGEMFDPNKHEPVETVAVTDVQRDNTVTKVYQRGYALYGTIIRPARVAIGQYKKDTD